MSVGGMYTECYFTSCIRIINMFEYRYICFNQSCWRNEGSMNRGMDRGRGLGIDEPFFCDSCSNLEIDEAFQISHKLGLDLAESFPKRELERSIDFEEYTPPPPPTLQNNLS
jgi:hypothetical protein